MFQTLAAKSRERAAIPFVAISLWLEQIQSGYTFDIVVPFTGMPKIFEAFAADVSLDRDAVARLAASAAWDQDTRDLALPVLRRAAARRKRSPIYGEPSAPVSHGPAW